MYWWMVDLIGTNFNLGVFLVKLLEFFLVCPLTGILGVNYGGVDFPNISAWDINDSLCVFTSVNSGLTGAGFCSAWIESCVAWMVASMVEIFGMLNCLGGNSTMSDIRSDLVLGYVCLMASAFFHGWYYVPSTFSVWCPWCSTVLPILNYHYCPWWG